MKKFLFATASFLALSASSVLADASFFEANGCDSEYLVLTDGGFYVNTKGKGCVADRGGLSIPAVEAPVDEDPVDEPDDNGGDTSGNGDDDEPGDDNGGDSNGGDSNGGDTSDDSSDDTNGDGSSDAPVFDEEPTGAGW